MVVYFYDGGVLLQWVRGNVRNTKTDALLPDPTRTSRGLVSTGNEAVGDLRSWADRDWSGGVELVGLAGLERFSVRTRNTTYEFTVLEPGTGAVLVRGGRFFPEQTRVHLAGCTLGGSVLKMCAIYPGFLMELMHDGQRIVTTRVQAIASLPLGTPQ